MMRRKEKKRKKISIKKCVLLFLFIFTEQTKKMHQTRTNILGKYFIFFLFVSVFLMKLKFFFFFLFSICTLFKKKKCEKKSRENPFLLSFVYFFIISYFFFYLSFSLHVSQTKKHDINKAACGKRK